MRCVPSVRSPDFHVARASVVEVPQVSRSSGPPPLSLSLSFRTRAHLLAVGTTPLERLAKSSVRQHACCQHSSPSTDVFQRRPEAAGLGVRDGAGPPESDFTRPFDSGCKTRRDGILSIRCCTTSVDHQGMDVSLVGPCESRRNSCLAESTSCFNRSIRRDAHVSATNRGRGGPPRGAKQQKIYGSS